MSFREDQEAPGNESPSSAKACTFPSPLSSAPPSPTPFCPYSVPSQHSPPTHLLRSTAPSVIMKSKRAIISRKLKEFGASLTRRVFLVAPFECTDKHHREMWAHIARHGLVMKTHRAHFDELEKTLDLDLLDFRTRAAAVEFLLKGLKEKVRSLRDQQILVCQHGVGARSVGAYPEWVQAWARPDWDGDIKWPTGYEVRSPSRDDNIFPSHDRPALSGNPPLDAVPQVDPAIMKARQEVVRRVGDEVKGIHVSRTRLSDRFEDAFSRQRANEPRSPKQRAANQRDTKRQVYEPRAASQRLAGSSSARQGPWYHGTAERGAASRRTSSQRDTGKRRANQPPKTPGDSGGRLGLEVMVEEVEADVLVAEAEVTKKQQELQDLTRQVSKWKEIDQISQELVAIRKESDRLDREILQAKNILAPLPYIPAQRLAEEGLGHILDRDCNACPPTSSRMIPDEPSLGAATVLREAVDKMQAGCRAKAEELAAQLRVNQRRAQADADAARPQDVDARTPRTRVLFTASIAGEDEESSSSDCVQGYELTPSRDSKSRFAMGAEIAQREQKHTACDDKQEHTSCHGSNSLLRPFNTPVELDATCPPRAQRPSSPQKPFPSSLAMPLPQTPRPAFSQPHRQDDPPVLTPVPPLARHEGRNPFPFSHLPRPLSLYDVERSNSRFFAHLKNRMSQLEGYPSASEIQHFEALRRRIDMANAARQQLFAAAGARNPGRTEGGGGSGDEPEGWF